VPDPFPEAGPPVGPDRFDPDRPAVDTTVGTGIDTDGDGRADTAVRTDGVDLILLTDLDGDGYVDQLLRIGPDGLARETPIVEPAGGAALRGLITGMEAGC
jgi:hypothetical protein